MGKEQVTYVYAHYIPIYISLCLSLPLSLCNILHVRKPLGEMRCGAEGQPREPSGATGVT